MLKSLFDFCSSSFSVFQKYISRKFIYKVIPNWFNKPSSTRQKQSDSRKRITAQNPTSFVKTITFLIKNPFICILH